MSNEKTEVQKKTHFRGAVAMGRLSVESITGAKTLSTLDNGQTFLLNAAAGAAITLPAPFAGGRYKFITALNFITTDWVITATGALMNGNVQEAGAVQVVTAATTINLELAAESLGDHIELVSDGISWFVSGSFALAASVTPA